MMDELLLDIFGEEQLKTVVASLKTLSCFNQVEAWGGIEVILMAEDVERFSKKLQVVDLLKDQLTEVLNLHWVFIKKDAPLALVNKLTYALYDSVTNYDPVQLLDAVPLIVTDENDSITAFAFLVEYLYDVYHLDIQEYLTMVDEDLITNIRTALETKVIPEIDSPDPSFKKRYLEYVGNRRSGVVYDFIVAGGRMGVLSTQALLTLMEEILDTLPTPELTFELGSLIQISSDDVTLDVIKAAVDFICDNASTADIVFTKLKLMAGTTDEN